VSSVSRDAPRDAGARPPDADPIREQLRRELPSPDAQAQTSPDWRIWLGLGITVAWLLLGSLYIGGSIGWSNIGRQPAEVIGNFLEGAFAPLAFLWLVIGYFLQQKELAQNTEALRLQFREIERTAEQAVKQTETISAQERHSRQQIFLQIHEQVRRQLGSIVGLLWISSQGGDEDPVVSDDEMSELWTKLNQGDPDVFSRMTLFTHGNFGAFEERLDFFYGTEVRARHTNNLIFTLERLLERARAADTDGILEDAILGSAHGYVYRLAVAYRARAPKHLADVTVTGRDTRFGMDLFDDEQTAGASAAASPPTEPSP
jgi:hypothetical protein